MSWFLWRELHRNRWLLAKAVVLIPLPHIVIALIMWDPVMWDPADLDSEYFHAYLISTVLSAMIVVGLASNSIAPDHADRSDEFISYLPFGRFQKLAFKLMVPLTAVVVLCAINLTIQMPPVETWPVGDWPPAGCLPETSHWCVLLAGAAFGICGVSWFVSSIQSSAPLAVTSGVISTFLVAGPFEEANFWFPFFPVLFATIGAACFWFGSRHYLRENMPYQMPAWVQARQDL
jgi:hypothetical protein